MKDQDVRAAKSLLARLRQSGDEQGARAVDALLREVAGPTVPRLDYYTAPEAGELLGVTGQTIKNWVGQGRIPGYRIGNRIVVPREAVEEYVRQAGASLDLDDLTNDEAASAVEEGRRLPFYAKKP
jgi:excisionase family DNA binding protein